MRRGSFYPAIALGMANEVTGAHLILVLEGIYMSHVYVNFRACTKE